MGIDVHAQVEIETPHGWQDVSRWNLGKDHAVLEGLSEANLARPVSVRRWQHPPDACFDEEERQVIDQGLYWCAGADFPELPEASPRYLSLYASLVVLMRAGRTCRVLFWQT